MKVLNIKNKYRFFIVIILVLIIGISVFYVYKYNKKSIFKYSDIVFNPYMSEEICEIKTTDFQENGVDYISPWMKAKMAITAICIEGNIDLAEEIITCAMDTFYRNGCFPRPAYDHYEYGWVSCMDAPTVGIASQMLYEKTRNKKYLQYINDLSDYILKDVKEKGFIADVDGNKWIFEFASVDTTEETGEFVLNGSLIGTLGIAMLADITGNTELKEIVNSQIKNYEKLMSEYNYSDGSWCYYRLNTKLVNQPHYVIFEIRILDALQEVTGCELFFEEAQKRRTILLENYKVYTYNENFEDAIPPSNEYLFIRGGAPHYYYNDIYETRLDFYDVKNELLKTDFLSGREYKNAFMIGECPMETDHITWTCKALYWSVDVGNVEITEMSNIDLDNRKVEYKVKAFEGASENNGEIELDYEKGRCVLDISFSSMIDLESDDIIIIEIDNKSAQEINTTNVIIYNEDGEGLKRYLKSIPSGKTCLYFSIGGFAQDTTIEFNQLSSFRLRLFTSEYLEEPIKVKLGDIYKMESPDEWYQYLQSGINVDWGA